MEKMNPCYRCEERTDRCHSECEKYTAWATEHAEKKAEERKQREKQWDLTIAHEEKYWRMRRK